MYKSDEIGWGAGGEKEVDESRLSPVGQLLGGDEFLATNLALGVKLVGIGRALRKLRANLAILGEWSQCSNEA